ncbi:MAG TPA: hypothetical protein VFT93_07475 [Candidatus Eisenbacteria bacterium]|nr:hypothetical protein [Candidatus Eisenbacteria bacterium]
MKGRSQTPGARGPSSGPAIGAREGSGDGGAASTTDSGVTQQALIEQQSPRH